MLAFGKKVEISTVSVIYKQGYIISLADLTYTLYIEHIAEIIGRGEINCAGLLVCFSNCFFYILGSYSAGAKVRRAFLKNPPYLAVGKSCSINESLVHISLSKNKRLFLAETSKINHSTDAER